MTLHEHASTNSPVAGGMDSETDMKLTVAFCKFANAPKYELRLVPSRYPQHFLLIPKSHHP